jgi:hypothetical protein
LDLHLSNDKINENLIGRIIYKNNLTEDEIIKRLQICNKIEITPVDFSPFEICVLPNGNLISANDGSVAILDHRLKTMRKKDFENSSIIGLASNNDSIYVTDFNKHCVYLMNLNLEIEKTFGSYGENNEQFKFPMSIACKSDILYVCDQLNKRIQIFDLDLEYIDSIKLNCQPFSIKLSCIEIGICGSTGVHFYDINTKDLTRYYENLMGRISYLDSYFYVASNRPTKIINCFDSHGNLIDKISNNKINEFISYNWDGFMFCFKNDLFITSNTHNKILRLKD